MVGPSLGRVCVKSGTFRDAGSQRTEMLYKNCDLAALTSDVT